MSNEPKRSPEEYHKWYKETYKTVSTIKHGTHFKQLVRGGEACVVPIDDNGNEIKED